MKLYQIVSIFSLSLIGNLFIGLLLDIYDAPILKYLIYSITALIVFVLLGIDELIAAKFETDSVTIIFNILPFFLGYFGGGLIDSFSMNRQVEGIVLGAVVCLFFVTVLTTIVASSIKNSQPSENNGDWL